MKKWLYIDSRARGSACFGWLSDSGKPKLWNVPADTPGLVSAISRKIKISDLAQAQGICVISGPGSFSSIRNGTLVANLLARIYGLPLYGLEAKDADDFVALVATLEKRQASDYVAPIYDQEPNVTLPKIK